VGIEAAVSQPHRTIRGDDHAMRCGSLTKWNLLVLARLRIKLAEETFALAGVPDGTVRCRCHVMRIGTCRQLVVTDLCGIGRLPRQHGAYTCDDPSHRILPR